MVECARDPLGEIPNFKADVEELETARVGGHKNIAKKRLHSVLFQANLDQ